MAAFDARPGQRSDGEATDPEEGFDGQLRCASLADLIQLQCGNRTRVAVSVRSEDREGHLFFDDGQIVHALAGAQVGVEAVFELLGWTTGTFGQSTAPWPETPALTSSWQQLLLTAAQRRDEARQRLPAASTSRLTAVRRTQPSTPVIPASRAAELAAAAQRPPGKPSAAPPAVKKATGLSASALDSVVCAARLDANGNALEMRGDAEKLLELAVYVRRLAELLGQSLGQSGFAAFECRSEITALVVFVDTPSSYVIVETTSLNELRSLYRNPTRVT